MSDILRTPITLKITPDNVSKKGTSVIKTDPIKDVKSGTRIVPNKVTNQKSGTTVAKMDVTKITK
jgi:hypothetical protein